MVLGSKIQNPAVLGTERRRKGILIHFNTKTHVGPYKENTHYIHNPHYPTTTTLPVQKDNILGFWDETPGTRCAAGISEIQSHFRDWI